MKRVFNTVLALGMVASLTACSSGTSSTSSTAETTATETGVEDGVLTVAMECAYSPYNWTQTDDSNDAVPIKDSSDYANGYDVMIAKKICEANGWELEVVRSDWDSLVPSVQSGVIDAIVAGQSMTSERCEQVDMAGPYYYSTFAIVVKSDSDLVNLTSIHDFGGYTGTAQSETNWYTDCLPQMDGVTVATAAESAPAMIMAVETGTVDFIVTDLPTATGAVNTYDDLTILDFTGTDGDFEFTEQEREEAVNIGISVKKGNTELKDAINAVLDTMTTDDFNELMDYAISIAPTED